ncbi:hypothetical protein [Natronococcus sp. A-GB7]|uniref:hypothetical protein n=1 Tax=Natronococcus sp. A-GB7 TaxID=3037649 RepID=UPI00241F4D75|nr:hypothetical protein [Natronococcus sp. A-GB7]MDG5820385.1 hypothetical protein [Natronococcus sp. A-GB7]
MIVPPVAVVVYGTVVGVAIDLDHFGIARLETGTWNSLRFCLTDPIAAFTDQDRIFERGDVGALSRLLSHLLLAGLAVSGTALADASLALVTGTVLYAHIVTDVAWDIRRLRRRSSVATDEVVPSHR